MTGRLNESVQTFSLKGCEPSMNMDQQSYWDNQTRKASYCDQFLSVANKNNWLRMLKKSLSALDNPEINSILEIGGGSQLLSRYLCKRYVDAQIICTDLSEERINLFQTYYGTKPYNLTLMGNVNAERLPFQNGQFDLIVGDAVVSHFEDSRRGFLEINRCLKSGGHAIFIREPIIGTLGILTYRLLQKMNRESEHITKNRFEYKRMLSQWFFEFIMAGFTVKTIGGWGLHPFTDRLRSAFPNLFPCFACFVLTKKTDIKEMNRS
jgi:ubiquinone/menaquinone biosynthesis C-methylase UbiE